MIFARIVNRCSTVNSDFWCFLLLMSSDPVLHDVKKVFQHTVYYKGREENIIVIIILQFLNIFIFLFTTEALSRDTLELRETEDCSIFHNGLHIGWTVSSKDSLMDDCTLELFTNTACITWATEKTMLLPVHGTINL